MALTRDQILAQGVRVTGEDALGVLLRKRRKKLGCSPRLVGEMERGRGSVGIDKVLAYAMSLGIDIVAFER